MFSIDALRTRLDNNFDSSVQEYQDLIQNTQDFTAADIHEFNQASRQISVASWAVNQDVVITHNLVRAIINEIK